MTTDYPICRACNQAFARTRGLCRLCYNRLANRVRAGKTTWQQLEAEGKVNPAKAKGGVLWGVKWKAKS